MTRRSPSPRVSRSPSARLEVSVARLEEQVEQALQLGDKFDRILDRIEQLALNTTTLISRHDTEIKTLQQQLTGAEMALNETKKEVSDLGDELKTHVSVQVAKIETSMKEQMTAMDARVSKLEKWRLTLIGAGLALGYLFSYAPKVFEMIEKFFGK